MQTITQYASGVLTTTALMFGMTACNKVGEKSSDTMGSAGNGVMTNTAGVSGAARPGATAQAASDSAYRRL